MTKYRIVEETNRYGWTLFFPQFKLLGIWWNYGFPICERFSNLQHAKNFLTVKRVSYAPSTKIHDIDL